MSGNVGQERRQDRISLYVAILNTLGSSHTGNSRLHVVPYFLEFHIIAVQYVIINVSIELAITNSLMDPVNGNFYIKNEF